MLISGGHISNRSMPFIPFIPFIPFLLLFWLPLFSPEFVSSPCVCAQLVPFHTHSNTWFPCTTTFVLPTHNSILILSPPMATFTTRYGPSHFYLHTFRYTSSRIPTPSPFQIPHTTTTALGSEFPLKILIFKVHERDIHLFTLQSTEYNFVLFI